MIMRNYIPGTETTRRRPTPVRFDHLRKWVQPVARSIRLGSVEEILDINDQLDQAGELFVDNIIRRVIAQIVGEYAGGLISLQASADGYLKVEEQGSVKVSKQAVINVATATTHTIVSAVSGKQICVTNITFVVAGEVNLTWKSDTTALSGAMDFGGTDEPRGITDNFGDSPFCTTAGQALKLTSSAAIQVSGYITYYEK